MNIPMEYLFVMFSKYHSKFSPVLLFSVKSYDQKHTTLKGKKKKQNNTLESMCSDGL